MRVEIDIKELAGELCARLRSEIDGAKPGSLPALLSRKEAADYLRVSMRMFDKFPIPRVVLTDRCVRYRREDLDRFALEKIRE